MKLFLRVRTVTCLYGKALTLLSGFMLIAATVPAGAQDVVRIGAIYPLSGPVAKSGEDTLNAIRLAVDVINGKYPGLQAALRQAGRTSQPEKREDRVDRGRSPGLS